MSTASRPALFIGSSVEGLPTAKAIQILLERECEAEIWSQGTFGLGTGTLEALASSLPRFDFAVLVVTPDDTSVVRGREKRVARDNVLFELGLFMGALGRERTFMVYDRTTPPDLPTDLAGVTCATFEPHRSGNLDAALGACCTQIGRAATRLGLREERRAADMTAATATVRSAGEHLEKLMRLMARSRKVELDIITTQFGPLIDPTRLSEIRRDLADLQEVLAPEKPA